MIPRRTVICLGFAQLILWGISFYLIGVFGEPFMAGLGWSRAVVYGGFSVALLVMAAVSPFVGAAIDRFGGRGIMAAGAMLCATGCTALAFTHSVAVYYAAWVCLGLAMRSTLYDAAFASLARAGGPAARTPIAQITLLGGLASTCFWPIGRALVQGLGWRGALLAYAGFAALTVPLLLTIPRERHGAEAEAKAGGDAAVPTAPPANGRSLLLPAALYALIVTISNALNSGLSAHLMSILTSLGLAVALAAPMASLWGIAQSLVRLANILFGGRIHPLALNLGATLIFPACLTVGFASGMSPVAAAAFVFLYGAGNGLMTITRGTMPLVLFDPAAYASLVGRLLVPSFVFAAASPLIYATVIERYGASGALWLSIGLALVMLAAALTLLLRCGGR